MATQQKAGAGDELLAAVMAKAKELRLKRKDAPSRAYLSLMAKERNAAYVVPQKRSVRLEVHAGSDDLPQKIAAASTSYSGGGGWRVFTVKTMAELTPALAALEIAAGLNPKGGKPR